MGVTVSEAVKERLIEKYRGTNVEHVEWWDAVYEYWLTEKFPAAGFNADKIYFSGFSSQGDGACFIGTVSLKEFIAVNKLEAEYPLLTSYTSKGYGIGCVSITHRGHYYHQYSMTFEMGSVDADDVVDELISGEELTRAVAVANNWADKVETEYIDLSEAVESMAADLACQLYKDLEEEYDHLVSDEAVWESLESNNFFDEDLTEGEDE